MIIVTMFGVVTAREAAVPAQNPPPGEPSGYAWAAACRDCHSAIYDAWEKTKHARAIGRLSGSEQEKECITCHVTGAPGKIERDGRVVNAGVQCERCHGPAAAHAADPAVKAGLARRPPESACLACHNEKSPHYRGFHYQGMLAFSHPVK